MILGKEFLVKEEVEETNERVNIDNPSISVKDLNCSWSKVSMIK